MGIATKQLEAIFREINEHFSQNRYVSIKPGEGDPPERYEVTYTISGLHQNKKNEVVEASQHTIAITIPFGFPHFPPNCKPISPIFHPDFDQAAICIGDFWKKESTISELIAHIGHMISGEIFSTVNAFNEDAVSWYKQHSDRLPFELVDFSTEPGMPPIPPPEMESFDELETLDIETLEEPELEAGLTALDLEQPLPSAKPFSSTAAEIDMDLLRLLAKQKRFYTLYSKIQAIPAESLNPVLEELRNEAHGELTKAKRIFQQGLDFENQGQPGDALEQFDLLSETVSDYPELEENIKRVQRVADTFEDLLPESKPKAEPKESRRNDRSSKPKPTQKDQPTFFTEKPEVRTPVLPIIVTVGVAILLGVTVFFYHSANSQLKQAQAVYSSCKDLLTKNDFSQAEKKCNEALGIVKDVGFLKTGAKKSLSAAIQATLSSAKMQQGLMGMVFVKGRYIPKSEKQALSLFTKQNTMGDSAMAKHSWKEAQTSYQEAMDIANRMPSLTPDIKGEIVKLKKNLALSQSHVLLDQGKSLKIAGDLDQSIIKLEKAKDEAMTLDHATAAPMLKSITPLINAVRFQQLQKKGDSLFAKGRWAQAADHYQKAIALGKTLTTVSASALTTLNENKTKAVLYDTIEKGKRAFDNAQWDTAIDQYESAIKLLKENSTILKQVSSEKNRRKLARIMLQASVIRDKQDVARQLKDKKYRQAIDKLETIIETIRKSPFSQEVYFQQLIKEVRGRITDTKHQKTISDGEKYLIANYKNIILKNYSMTRSDALSEPNATFMKKIGTRFLFKIECTDSSQGRPLTLIMYYTFNPVDGKWMFYNSTQ